MAGDGSLIARQVPWLVRALAAVSLASAACLPRGDAPAGRQIVADQNAILLQLVPATGDGVLRVLFFRPGQDPKHIDLWVAAVPPDGGPTSELKLFTGLDSDAPISYRPSADRTGFPMDAQGRLLLTNLVDPTNPAGVIRLSRIDPVTGETLDLGEGSSATPSPSGHRLLISNFLAGSETLYDETDGSTTLLDSQSATFVDETLIYLTTSGDLMRFLPGGVPERVASGVYRFQLAADDSPSSTSHLLLLIKAVPDADTAAPPSPGQPPTTVTASVFDVVTLAETALPAGPLYQYGTRFSPDGRWLTVNQPSRDLLSPAPSTILVDTVTGTTETLEAPFDLFSVWRPGHAEMWAYRYDPDGSGALSASALSIKRPGQPAVVFPGFFFDGFNQDGSYWFSRGAPFDAQESSDLVGLADDPAAPRVAAVPNGSSLDYQWTLADGRLLLESSLGLDSFQAFFVNVVDPRTGDGRLVGERGFLSAVGRTRALGIYHASFLRGDLTTTDFTNGQSTVLAPEFAVSAVAEPQADDRYPPGGRIVYQFQARYASPWDGLWMATVP